MKVIGTAGHVDHGKSRLILAMTGINPDRLKEEQEREMTIDLGFAWLEVPGKEKIGIIDVPGHIDFIDNMLAGVGAIDAALIVIAADEGIMPQTREHLSILDLLDIERAVVALTKIDLIEDEEWLELVNEEIRGMLAQTKLASSPIIPVSSETGVGLERLVMTIHDVLSESETRKNVGRPRLPIDRVFSISGFGTIVTGTLVDGDLHAGQEVVVLPEGRKSRIRGLQTHKQKIDTAVPGSRVAVNLTGVEVGELKRGDVVSIPGEYSVTRSVEVHYRHLRDAGTKLQHNMKLKMFTGSSQREARIRLLGCDEIKPGETGWLQIMLEKPIVAERGDHYILRRPSPGTTLGGGVIIEPHPRRKRRRFDEGNIRRLKELLQGKPSDLLSQSLNDLGPTKLAEAVRHARIEKERQDQAVRELGEKGDLINLEDDQSGGTPKMNALVVSRQVWNDYIDRINQILGLFHRDNTLRLGMPFEELKARLNLSNKLFNLILRRAEDLGAIKIDQDRVALSGHKTVLTKTQDKARSEILDVFKSKPYATPSVKESIEVAGDDLYQYLLETGELLQVSKDVVLRCEDYQEMSDMIQKFLKEEGSITVAEVRDLFKTSRKYALAVMEHLDAVGITTRKGDKRVLN